MLYQWYLDGGKPDFSNSVEDVEFGTMEPKGQGRSTLGLIVTELNPLMLFRVFLLVCYPIAVRISIIYLDSSARFCD